MMKIDNELTLIIDFLMWDLGVKSASAPNFLNFCYELMYSTLYAIFFYTVYIGQINLFIPFLRFMPVT